MIADRVQATSKPVRKLGFGFFAAFAPLREMSFVL